MNNIIKVESENLETLIKLSLELWPHHIYEEIEEEYKALNSANNAFFLFKEDNMYIGFIHVSLRHDYVEGSNSSPVGYVEGIYVKEEYRGKGIAKSLVKSGEEWAATKGCTEMASDIEAQNHVSYDFHKSIGFKEVNRIICFIKDIEK
ncbi:aminoglycoside 6'-N-acetyltransferase [Inconstantimicrobium mannanitabidum]|uniref:Cryptic aminoglycoside N-acetyltransferase AAC(6')-Iy/Iaa n=1 Tax=Inconstantimicrobium mannanitabidum TaxID=1604901 RepID=A0ACB5REY2_9CLOT|nr:aminoglycoside 6'-N-acetyltransferase [Clostridium sp. TW13]GKX67306.1 cryptic aminoglycoside N-acetyltransferase AAC(6')-Iy/Iaa [Clostridium sp. TW13]